MQNENFDDDKYVDALRAVGRLEEAYNAYKSYQTQAMNRYEKFSKRASRPLLQRKKNQGELLNAQRKANAALKEATDANLIVEKLAQALVSSTLTTQAQR